MDDLIKDLEDAFKSKGEVDKRLFILAKVRISRLQDENKKLKLHAQRADECIVEFERVTGGLPAAREIVAELRASDNWLHRLLKSCVILIDDGEVTKRGIEKQSRYNQKALKGE